MTSLSGFSLFSLPHYTAQWFHPVNALNNSKLEDNLTEFIGYCNIANSMEVILESHWSLVVPAGFDESSSHLLMCPLLGKLQEALKVLMIMNTIDVLLIKLKFHSIIRNICLLSWCLIKWLSILMIIIIGIEAEL
jgi:hypothetical protein